MKEYKIQNQLEYNYEKLKKIKQTMSFSDNKDYSEQKDAISKKFRELVKMPEPLKECTLIKGEIDTSDSRFDEIRVLIETEPDFYIPAHLIYPKNLVKKVPLVICLQGHSPGMHISLAREKYPSKTPILVEGDRDFCIQAVSRGYAALALEQRGFGELSYKENDNCCHDLVWQSALMGQTLLGQRLYDVSNALTAVISEFDFIDDSRIGVMGNSGGGTVSYYVACVDERIKVSMPSSCFGSILHSWGASYHCDCGYIFDILNYFEMADLAVMIAPRYLVIVNGKYDDLQPFVFAKKEFERLEQIFEKAGFKENCQFVEGPEGHRFYADLAWGYFDKFINA